jgi:hypothetical protein
LAIKYTNFFHSKAKIYPKIGIFGLKIYVPSGNPGDELGAVSLKRPRKWLNFTTINWCAIAANTKTWVRAQPRANPNITESKTATPTQSSWAGAFLKSRRKCFCAKYALGYLLCYT